MPKYKVTWQEVHTCETVVEAATEEDAINDASNQDNIKDEYSETIDSFKAELIDETQN